MDVLVGIVKAAATVIVLIIVGAIVLGAAKLIQWSW